eukprot:m.486702 g.486702  ORF g.486702 m.486702 type:complete len:57 (+) comp79284_c0_seq1:32-202(+)
MVLLSVVKVSRVTQTTNSHLHALNRHTGSTAVTLPSVFTGRSQSGVDQPSKELSDR